MMLVIGSTTSYVYNKYLYYIVKRGVKLADELRRWLSLSTATALTVRGRAPPSQAGPSDGGRQRCPRSATTPALRVTSDADGQWGDPRAAPRTPVRA